MDDWDDDLPGEDLLIEFEKQALVKRCDAQVDPFEHFMTHMYHIRRLQAMRLPITPLTSASIVHRQEYGILIYCPFFTNLLIPTSTHFDDDD